MPFFERRTEHMPMGKGKSAGKGGGTAAAPRPDPLIEVRAARDVSPGEQQILLETLRERFEKNRKRHPGVDWAGVQARLEKSPEKLRTLNAMELTGGEPDVVAHDAKTGTVTFFDCSPQTPAGRRNTCFDREALDSRKEHKPPSNALEFAEAIGIQLLSEEQYRQLQQLGEFDTTTSSWIVTPPEIRKRGGALFADRRYDTVFVYHNGAESYYAARGFRGSLVV
jgi:hypothetical protein